MRGKHSVAILGTQERQHARGGHMFTVEAQVTIERPVGEVYHFLLEPANYSRWIADVKAVQATAPLRVGQTFEEVTLFQGQEKRSVGQVVEARTNACLVLRIAKGALA